MNPATRRQIPRFVTFGVIGLFLLATVTAVWLQLTGEEKSVLRTILDEHPALIVSALFLFPLAVVLAVNWVFRHYIEPVRKMVEEVKVMNLVNPSHRLAVEGSHEIEELSAAVNRALDRIQSLQDNVQEVVNQTHSQLEAEKSILVTLIDEFPDGVLVCTKDGQIILYNRRVRGLLIHEESDAHPSPGTDHFIGLGRSIFGFINRNLFVHAVEVIDRKLHGGDERATAHFVTAGGARQLLRIEMAPVVDQQGVLQGYILLVTNIAHQLAQEQRRAALVQSLVERLRASLATIRTSVEVLLGYPGMESKHRDKLTGVIRDESLTLSAYLESSAKEHAENLTTQWLADDMLCNDILEALQRQSEQSLDVKMVLISSPDQVWVRVDSYMTLQALLFLVSAIKQATGVIDYRCRAGLKGDLASIDILWKGSPLPSATVGGWEAMRLRIEGQEIPLTLGDVLRRHGAELWSGPDDDQVHAHMRVLLPRSQSAGISEARRPGAKLQSRPEFYDFNLFTLSAGAVPLGERSLSDLTYTAFDTETTGLRPSEGDEIISIGAARIVNGRILREEVFEQLVDPRRELTRESISVHGIDETMLLGQPTIEVVLPMFSKFVQGTVLVAHNASFDMRFLQLKEEQSGMKFDGPVLDTLLLSAAVHPHQEDHTIEGIAQRLGINVVGRHTALGDAIVTGEVFLKLLPLLADGGIRTLQQALDASRKTYLARVKY